MYDSTIDKIRTKCMKFCDAFSYSSKPDFTEKSDVFDYITEQKQETTNLWLDDYGWI